MCVGTTDTYFGNKQTCTPICECAPRPNSSQYKI